MAYWWAFARSSSSAGYGRDTPARMTLAHFGMTDMVKLAIFVIGFELGWLIGDVLSYLSQGSMLGT